MNKYFLRVPAVSLLWLSVTADSEQEALDKVVRRINSKNINYAVRECWEIKHLELCDGRDETELDESLTGHRYHCPACHVHLTSLLLCPSCFIRYEPPETRA